MYYRDLQDIPGDRGCVSPGWGPRPVVSEKFCLGFCKAAVSTFTFAPQACVSLCFHCWKPRKHRKSPNYCAHCIVIMTFYDYVFASPNAPRLGPLTLSLPALLVGA